VDEQSEGVAAYTRECVRRRYRRLQAMGDLDQHAIPDRVSERVVDGAEAIEVDRGHGNRPAGVMSLGERSGQPLLEEVAVGKAGERIVRGDMVQPSVGFGHVVAAAA